MRGQARISFWLNYNGGEIEIDPEEIRDYKWVDITELEHILKNSNWPLEVVENLIFDLNKVLNK